jgi:hypothetical protein
MDDKFENFDALEIDKRSIEWNKFHMLKVSEVYARVSLTLTWYL